MAARLPLGLITAALTGVRDRLELRGDPDASVLGEVLELLNAPPSDAAIRQKKYRDKLRRDANVTLESSRSDITRYANRDAKVTSQPPLCTPPLSEIGKISKSSEGLGSEPPFPPDERGVTTRDANVASRAEAFNSSRLTELFSGMRKNCGGGAYQQKRSDYDRLQAAIDWARAEDPEDPERACAQSIGNYLRLATGSWADGWPFGGWANDPGRWFSAGKEAAAESDADRRERQHRERIAAENRRIAEELAREERERTGADA